MSGYYANSLTLYMRPAFAIPAYQQKNCAAWLTAQEFFPSIEVASRWLDWLARTDSQRFKSIMSAYFEATDYRQKYIRPGDSNRYQTSDVNFYGDDPHMWY